MVRKWSTVPISLSYTTPYSPHASVINTRSVLRLIWLPRCVHAALSRLIARRGCLLGWPQTSGPSMSATLPRRPWASTSSTAPPPEQPRAAVGRTVSTGGMEVAEAAPRMGLLAAPLDAAQQSELVTVHSVAAWCHAVRPTAMQKLRIVILARVWHLVIENGY
jgi:hypothetical protein